jgi:hypothetical protein
LASYSYALLPAESPSNFGFQLFQRARERKGMNIYKNVETGTNFNHGHIQRHTQSLEGK